jgi:hypothetical protein
MRRAGFHTGRSRLACGQRSRELQDFGPPVGRSFRADIVRHKLSEEALELGWQWLLQHCIIIGIQPGTGQGARRASASAMMQN